MAEIQQYDIGDVVRISGVFTTLPSTAVDPATVKLFVKRPAGGDQIELTYGVGSEITRDGTGSYHADVPIDMAGDWKYRWVSTGAGKAAEPGWFTVRRSNVG